MAWCLQAVLPPSFSFVIKREMSAVPLAGTLCGVSAPSSSNGRTGVRGARDARRLLRNAERGEALVFFPEGTFSAVAGLLRFHIGAFAAAARARAAGGTGGHSGHPPVSAARPHAAASGADRGRSAGADLRAIALPASTNPTCAARLRNTARAALLAALGEPDLAAVDPDLVRT